MFDTVIVEDVVRSGVPNCKKLDFDSLKMIQNDTVSRPMKRGIVGL